MTREWREFEPTQQCLVATYMGGSLLTNGDVAFIRGRVQLPCWRSGGQSLGTISNALLHCPYALQTKAVPNRTYIPSASPHYTSSHQD